MSVKFLVPILLILLWPLYAFAQVVFSEIMFDVPGADYDDEFVELYNCSASPVDLAGWQFSDSSGYDTITDAGQGTVLQPGQFAVLLDGSYFGNSTTYDTLIPPTALILSIDDNAFGSSGLSNTRGERLSLINAAGRVVAVYRYSPNNVPGYSDEKIDLCAGDDSSNWANSLRLWGTPGFKNSVTPEDYDLGFEQNALHFKPQSAVKKGQKVQAELVVANTGKKLFDASVRFTVFVDFNGNGRADPLEPVLLQRQKDIYLEVKQQDSLHFDFAADFSGALSVVALLTSGQDQNPANNSIAEQLIVIDQTVPLKINEIKFLTQKGEPEWVELFNAGTQEINLRDWALTDAKDTARIERNVTIFPTEFKVITDDSSLLNFYALADDDLLIVDRLPRLNNDADVLYLLAPWDDWIDQVPYEKSWLWGEENRLPSLERINPKIDGRMESNWGPSVAEQGATPAKVNSLFEPLHVTNLKLNVEPNPFSPDGDGFEDNTIVSLQLPTNAARVRATIYDILGRKIITLTDDHLMGQTGQLIWNGRDERKQRVRTGIYIIFVQILDDRNGVLQEAKATIDVAR